MDLRGLIRKHEGLRLNLYKDSRGLWTIGYGRCLQVNGISADEADYMLSNDINRTISGLLREYDWFSELGNESLTRQYSVVDIAFNVGVGGTLPDGKKVGIAGFEKMIEAIIRKDWETAAAEILDSDFAHLPPPRQNEISDRARDDAHIMLTGEFPE